jgi:hypothetical protein
MASQCGTCGHVTVRKARTCPKCGSLMSAPEPRWLYGFVPPKLAGSSPMTLIAKSASCVLMALGPEKSQLWLRSSVPLYLGGGWWVQPDPPSRSLRYSHDPNREFIERMENPKGAGRAPHPSTQF